MLATEMPYSELKIFITFWSEVELITVPIISAKY